MLQLIPLNNEEVETIHPGMLRIRVEKQPAGFIMRGYDNSR
jgi:hypothetical protein